MTEPVLIALDWGTSSLRAFLLDNSGAITHSLAEPLGILNVPDNNFDAVYQKLIGPWQQQYDDLPAIASGMIGSRQGWLEAPYIACPATVEHLAKQLSEVITSTQQSLWLVPGVSFQDSSGIPDVIRGEETQIFGELVSNQSSRQLFILPGTHSKWVLVEDNRIVWFATFMTGEVFAVLQQHSILGRLMTDTKMDSTAFKCGLNYAANNNSQQGGLLKKLFSTRTLGLFDQIPSDGIYAYLSGLLIGSEIAEGLACVENRENRNAIKTITLIGEPVLTGLYEQALQQYKISCQQGTANAVAAGLLAIASTAGLLE